MWADLAVTQKASLVHSGPISMWPDQLANSNLSQLPPALGCKHGSRGVRAVAFHRASSERSDLVSTGPFRDGHWDKLEWGTLVVIFLRLKNTWC